MCRSVPEPKVALDSQCFSYLLDAIAGIEEPTDSLAEERKALIRSWFYMPGTFYLPSTVISECEQIKTQDRRDLHASLISTLFLEMPAKSPGAIAMRVYELKRSHDKLNDCRVLAEAEEFGITHLLTYDRRFLLRLGPLAKGAIVQKPSTYWQELGIPRGAKPRTVPHETNPLSHQSWWRW